MLIVQKFGGSSLADGERLRHVAELCLSGRAREAELVLVVSAMGDATDRLSRSAREVSPAPPKRELDALVTTGEQQAAALLVMAMQELGLDAVSLTGWQAGILTDGAYGAGWYAAAISLFETYNRGYFEIRCKCNDGGEFWSAFWIQADHPYDHELSKGGVGGAELDI